MALPSARRPVAAVEVREEEKKEELKVRLKKDEWFLKAMNEFCEFMTPKRRATLTLKIFMRRATLEAYRLNFDMDKLPPNWMRTVLDANDMTLFKRKKRYTKHEIDQDQSSDSDEEMDKSFGPPKKKNRKSIGRMRSSASTSTAAANEASTYTFGKDSKGNPYKKYVDLTNEPPPGWWLQEYAKGNGPQRELRVFSSEDQNIVFYDYTQEEKEQGAVKYVRRPHDKDNVNFDRFFGILTHTREKEASRVGGRTETATRPEPLT